MTIKNHYQCNLKLIYNVHNKHTQWQFISDLLDHAKSNSYNHLFLEVSHREKFVEFKKLVDLIKQNPNFESQVMDELMKGNTSYDHLRPKISTIRDIKDPAFKEMLKMINDRVSGNAGVDQYVQLGQKRVALPAKVGDFKSLNEEERAEALIMLKDQANRILKDNSPGSSFGSLTIKALIKNFKVHGMDVANDKECRQDELHCRDEFMVKKLMDHCTHYGANIIASVGLSHLGMGDLLRQGDVNVNEYYPVDYSESSDSSIHNDIISNPGRYPYVTILDVDSVEPSSIISYHEDL